MYDYASRYGVVSRMLHHVMLILMLFQFTKLFNYWNDKQNIISQTIPPQWHASFGIILSVLVVLRLLWAIMQRHRRSVHGMAAKIGHAALYVFMLLAPITGICLVLGKGYGLRFFGTEMVARGGDYAHLLAIGQWHSAVTLTFGVLLLGHIAMALYHHVIKGDKILKKMFG